MQLSKNGGLFSTKPLGVIFSSFPSMVSFFIHLCVLFPLNIVFFICFKLNNPTMFIMQEALVGCCVDEGNDLRGSHVVW